GCLLVPHITNSGLGNASAHETISPRPSATGLSVASTEESGLRRDAVVVIIFIRCFCAGAEGPRAAGLPCPVEPRAYARTAPFVLRRAITSPKVIFGAFGSALSSFSSLTQLDARRVDSSACAEVSKRLTEVMTPLPASIRK